MTTDLARIGNKARKEPGVVFTSLYHHVTDPDNLLVCYGALEANKASGIDGVIKEEYLYHVTRILFKWLNRKSQRRSYTWKGYEQALRHVRWLKPRIRKDLNPFRRAEAI